MQGYICVKSPINFSSTKVHLFFVRSLTYDRSEGWAYDDRITRNVIEKSEQEYQIPILNHYAAVVKKRHR